MSTDSPARNTRDGSATIPEDEQVLSSPAETSPVLIVGLCFSVALIAVIFISMNFPPFTEDQQAKIKMPRSVADVQDLASVMKEYQDDYWWTVLLAYSLYYIFLQTFSIPGSIFLSFLGGTLFGLPLGVALVCALSACGASGAFYLSTIFGRGLLEKYFPDKTKFLAGQVREHKDNLFNYFLFLRLSPLLPNWFVNIASPVVRVPIKVFWFGTFFGVSVQTFIAVKAGLTLHEITEPSEVLNLNVFFTLLLLSILSLLPTKFGQKFIREVLLREKTGPKTE